MMYKTFEEWNNYTDGTEETRYVDWLCHRLLCGSPVDPETQDYERVRTLLQDRAAALLDLEQTDIQRPLTVSKILREVKRLDDKFGENP